MSASSRVAVLFLVVRVCLGFVGCAERPLAILHRRLFKHQGLRVRFPETILENIHLLFDRQMTERPTHPQNFLVRATDTLHLPRESLHVKA